MFKNHLLTKLLVLITYIGMVAVNALANILPINGLNTGGVSDAYPNIFAPAGVTFSIWGLIYFLLLLYVGYQFFRKSPETEKVYNKVNTYFIISSVTNAAWIFAWHYQQIGLSVILMLVLLFSLIKISRISNEQVLPRRDTLFLKIPFGVYFGWITIATIANITTLLVSLGWKNFVFPDAVWMILILVIGMVIASVTTIREKNLAYGLVPIWAYFGIYLKHTSPLYFDNMYPNVITTIVACMLVFVLVNGYLVYKKRTV